MDNDMDVKTGWQPIETAPEDTPLMLCSPEGKIGIGFISPREMSGVSFRTQGAAWIGEDSWSRKLNVTLGGYTPSEATHWMPLPTPPSPVTQ